MGKYNDCESRSVKPFAAFKASLIMRAVIYIVIIILVFTAAGCAVPVSGDADGGVSPSPSLKAAPSAAVASPSSTPWPTEAEKDDRALLSLAEINPLYAEYGAMTIEGMKPEDYDSAISIEWNPLDTAGEPENMSVDISELMDYGDIEEYIINLDRYDGVEASVLGLSERGRNIYMLKLDFGKADEEKPLIMLTGAREFAGPDYLIKLLNDTVIKSYKDDETRRLLENVTIVAVPLVNPDGRELIIEGGDHDHKANANGIDLNRAMPSVNAGQLGEGNKISRNYSTEPCIAYFAGYNLGSESETQAMIRWFNYYVPKASAYIDLHQQGGITYYNKGYMSEQSDGQSEEFADSVNKLLKKGYRLIREAGSYGLKGVGGTVTDYAKSVAEGLRFSYGLGRFALSAGGDELPLIAFRDIDDYPQYYKPVNAGFKSICIEIGRNRKYLGPSRSARRYREKEFYKYNWPGFLTGVAKIVGEENAD